MDAVHYERLGRLFQRIGALAPARRQLLEAMLADAGGEASRYYDSLAGDWRNATASDPAEERYLTFAPFPEILPGFSWIESQAFPERHPAHAKRVLAAQQAMRRILFRGQSFAAGQAVLDIGCGYGSDLAALGRLHSGLDVTGFTISAKQAELGNRRLTELGLANRGRIHHRDSAAAPFPRAYDLIFGFEVVHHIRDKARLFANIGAGLAPGGEVVLADFIAETRTAIEHETTSSFFITAEEWEDLFAAQQLELYEAIDVSDEIANFLHDPAIDRHLAEIDRMDESVAAALRSYHQLEGLLRKRLARYVLLKARRTDRADAPALRAANRARLTNLTPYRLADERLWLYRTTWQEAETSPPVGDPRGNWLVAAEAATAPLVRSLRASGARCCELRLTDGPCEFTPDGAAVRATEAGDFDALVEHLRASKLWPLAGIVYGAGLLAETTNAAATTAPSMRQSRIALGGLQLWQAIQRAAAGEPATAAWWLVTRGTQAVGTSRPTEQLDQATLWGLGRTLRWENPGVPLMLVDAGANDPAALADELRSVLANASAEPEIALRDGRRWSARFARFDHLALPRENAPFHFSATGGHLVTGGIGGLGLALLEWMAERGARMFWLATRRASPPPDVAQRLDALRAQGVTITLVPADIANRADAERLFAAIEATDVSLQGVWHLAGVIDDARAEAQTWERCEKVLRPKVDGGWNLHVLSQRHALEYFVCFSSLASVVGAAGQANYAAANAWGDALVRLRRAAGLPGLAINWGPWAGEGMAANVAPEVVARWRALGLELIPGPQGFALLGELLAAGVAEAAVQPVASWPQFLRAAPPALRPTFSAFALSSTAAEDAAPPLPAIDLATVPAAEREEVLRQYFNRLFVELFKLPPGAVLDEAQPLHTLGLDSLMAVELKERIDRDFALDLAIRAFLDGMSTQELRQSILREWALRDLTTEPVTADQNVEREVFLL